MRFTPADRLPCDGAPLVNHTHSPGFLAGLLVLIGLNVASSLEPEWRRTLSTRAEHSSTGPRRWQGADYTYGALYNILGTHLHVSQQPRLLGVVFCSNEQMLGCSTVLLRR